MEIYTPAAKDIEYFFNRSRLTPKKSSDLPFDTFLKEILQKACHFIPCKRGSILLDDPLKKSMKRQENVLVFIACFGGNAKDLLGKTVPGNMGVIGQVYQTGKSFISKEVRNSDLFLKDLDDRIGSREQSIICAPLRIEREVVGLIELIDRIGTSGFSDNDLLLLEIFAGYTSISIQGAIDARNCRNVALRDDLTGLFNDRYLHAKLLEEIEQADNTGKDLSIIFFDLDFFKTINDEYGHISGSTVLSEIGYILKNLALDKDITLCRYGGDEFVVILADVNAKEALEFAEKIRFKIENHRFLKERIGYFLPSLITASFGVASLKEHLQAPELTQELKKDRLVKLADSAMVKAKGLGRNGCCLAEATLP